VDKGELWIVVVGGQVKEKVVAFAHLLFIY
jgi:hypothetical protein